MVTGSFAWRGHRVRAVLLACAFAALCLAGAPAATAQPAADAAAAGAAAGIEARREALFARMLDNPGDLQVAFEYAALSAEAGDYEAAISTLERMLIFAPDLPRVQLELGVLYYRIGATDVARTYFEAVLAREGVPPQVRERVEVFLTQLDQQDRRFTANGSIYAGVRYQSNANAAPENQRILLGGLPFILSPDSRGREDVNVFLLTNTHFAYDLHTQGDLIEADIVSYNTGYGQLSRLNTNLVEGTLGPSFHLGRFGWESARLGVYGILGGTALGGEAYQAAYGAGARLSRTLGDRILLDSRVEYRYRNYYNTPDYPTVRLQSGDEWRTQSSVVALLTPRLTLSGGFESRWQDARVGFNRFTEIGGYARAGYMFTGIEAGWIAAAPWNVSLGVGGFVRDFDAPDPVLDPNAAEHDEVLWVEAGLSVPLQHGFAMFVNGQYRNQDSNYATRDFDNAVATVGLSKLF